MIKRSCFQVSLIVFMLSSTLAHAVELGPRIKYKKVTGYEVLMTQHEDAAHSVVFHLLDENNKMTYLDVYISGSVDDEFQRSKAKVHQKMYDTLKMAYITGESVYVTKEKNTTWIARVFIGDK